MLKKLVYGTTTLFMTTALLAAPPLERAVNPHDPAVVATLINKSKKDFAVCDVQKLTATFNSMDEKKSSPFSVQYMADKEANYNYYLVTDRNEVNADKIRGAACAYIMSNKCYIYWGNVANVAAIADKKAAWFPLDTSSHYMLSPYITCDKIMQRKQQVQKK